MSEDRGGVKGMVGPALILMLPGLLLVPATFAFSAIDLEGPLALAAYVVSETGGVFGLPWVVAALTALLCSQPGRAGGGRHAARILVVSLALLGGISALNEFWTKRQFRVPRPNVIELGEVGALGSSAEEFYREPDKDRRRELLAKALAAPGRPGPRLHPWIARHWAWEAGFSFPSGHSLAAFLFSTIFIGVGRGENTGWRRGLVLALIPWAPAVAFARVLLRVHSPTDVLVGGVLGLALGLLGLWIIGRAPGAEKAE